RPPHRFGPRVNNQPHEFPTLCNRLDTAIDAFEGSHPTASETAISDAHNGASVLRQWYFRAGVPPHAAAHALSQINDTLDRLDEAGFDHYLGEAVDCLAQLWRIFDSMIIVSDVSSAHIAADERPRISHRTRWAAGVAIRLLPPA